MRCPEERRYDGGRNVRLIFSLHARVFLPHPAIGEDPGGRFASIPTQMGGWSGKGIPAYRAFGIADRKILPIVLLTGDLAVPILDL